MKRQRREPTKEICKGCGVGLSSDISPYFDGGYWHPDCCPVVEPTTIRMDGSMSEITMADWVVKSGGRQRLMGTLLLIRNNDGVVHAVTMTPEVMHAFANSMHDRIRAKSTRFHRY